LLEDKQIHKTLLYICAEITKLTYSFKIDTKQLLRTFDVNFVDLSLLLDLVNEHVFDSGGWPREVVKTLHELSER
jgi:hypothetical protein